MAFSFSQIGMFVIALIGLGFVVGFHEFGHFLFCKLFSIRTPTFSIGFGPKIWSKKIGGTTFALSAIPVGGYVEIAGQDEEEAPKDASKIDPDQSQNNKPSLDPHLFNNKPYWQKLLVMLGGIIFNLIFAFAALSLVFYFGAPKSAFLFDQTATPIVQEVTPGSPADQAGILPGDQLVSLNGTPIENTPTSLRQFLVTLNEKEGKQVTLELTRAGVSQTVTPTLNAAVPGKSLLGTGLYKELPPQTLGGAIQLAWNTVTSWSTQIYTLLVSLVSSKSLNGIGGPIALLSGIMQGSKEGILMFLLVLAFISVNLAIINLIPLPIFDGGQVVMYSVEAITRCSLDRIRPIVGITSWVLVTILTVYLVIKDIICLCK